MKTDKEVIAIAKRTGPMTLNAILSGVGKVIREYGPRRSNEFTAVFRADLLDLLDKHKMMQHERIMYLTMFVMVEMDCDIQDVKKSEGPHEQI